MEGFKVHYKLKTEKPTHTFVYVRGRKQNGAPRTIRSWLRYFRAADVEYWHIRSASGHIIAMSKDGGK